MPMPLFRLLGAVLLWAVATLSQAEFSIIGTRVIYDEARGEADVHLQRVTGEQPVLLQAWLDDGSPSALPGTQALPFILTPAVARVDAGGAQVIRIFRVGDNLPLDRETLLFFNALVVPPESEASQRSGEGSLQLGMQARMKFFYRPRGLTPAPMQAPKRLQFTLAAPMPGKTPAGASLPLQIHNPTPYHITLRGLALVATNAGADDTPLAQMRERGGAPMVAPFSSLTVSLDVQPGARLPAAPLAVRYTFINDQGGENTQDGALGDAG